MKKHDRFPFFMLSLSGELSLWLVRSWRALPPALWYGCRVQYSRIKVLTTKSEDYLKCTYAECHLVPVYSKWRQTFLWLISPKLGPSHQNSLDGWIAPQVRGKWSVSNLRVDCPFKLQTSWLTQYHLHALLASLIICVISVQCMKKPAAATRCVVHLVCRKSSHTLFCGLCVCVCVCVCVFHWPSLSSEIPSPIRRLLIDQYFIFFTLLSAVHQRQGSRSIAPLEHHRPLLPHMVNDIHKCFLPF